MVTQHGSFGKRALARKSSSEAIADDELDPYAEIVYELYGERRADKALRSNFPLIYVNKMNLVKISSNNQTTRKQ